MTSSKLTHRLWYKGLSLTLVVMMLLTVVPTAFAANGDLTGVSISPGSLSLKVGGSSGKITATASYEGGSTSYDATFSANVTSGDGIVSLSNSGSDQFSIAPESAGQATVTVTAYQSSSGRSYSDSITVTVSKPAALTDLDIVPSSLTLDLKDSSSPTASVDFAVGKTGSPDIDFTLGSNDTSIATVGSLSSTSFTVTGHKVGTATVELVGTYDGVTKKDTMLVNVVDTTPVVPDPVQPSSVGFSTSSVEITIPFGDASASKTINYTVYPDDVDAAYDTVTFDSSNNSVVSISPTTHDGRTGTITLTGNKAGEATITATTVNGKTATSSVKVSDQVIEATSLSLETESVTMKNVTTVGYHILPIGYNTPASVSVYAVTSDSDVVMAQVFSGYITLTAQGPGTADVTVSTSAGLPTKVIHVVVKSDYVPATNLTFDTSSITINIPSGSSTEDGTIGFNFTPNTTDDAFKTCVSSDTSIVDYKSRSGNTITLTGKKAGTATMTLTSQDGLTATLQVTVKDSSVAATSLTFDTSAVTIAVSGGTTTDRTVGFTFTPSSSTDAYSKVESSDTSIVELKSHTASSITLTGKKAGTATVTLTSQGGLTATLQVTVTDDVVTATGLTFDTSTVNIAISGSTTTDRTVGFTFTPSDTTDAYSKVESSDTDIVELKSHTASSITLTGKKAGTATVTLTSQDGLTATLHVTVTDDTVAATSVTFSTSSTVMNITSSVPHPTRTIGFSYTPGNANDDSFLSCVSSDPSIVDFTSNTESTVTLTANKAGTALITLTTQAGLKATLNVTVTDQTVAATGVEFMTSSTMMHITDRVPNPTSTIGYAFLPGNANNDSFLSCVSSNPAVVNFTSHDAADKEVTLTAYKAGSAVVTLTTLGGLKATLNVIVTDDTVVATGVTFSTSSTVMGITSSVPHPTRTIGFTYTPGNANDDSFLSCVSNDPSIVEFTSNTDSTVTLTANKAGTALITLTTQGGLKATLNVTVTDQTVAATGLAFSTPATVIKIPLSETEESLTIGYSFTPGNANNDSFLSCASSDVSIVNYVSHTDNSVTLTGYKAGTATVTLTSMGGLTAKLEVMVADSTIPATGIVFAPSSVNMTIPSSSFYATQTVGYSFQPGDSTEAIDLIGSSDNSVASAFTSNGSTIALTAFKAGDAVITVVSTGGVKATFTVHVTMESPDVVEPIQITPQIPVVYLFKGDTADVTFLVDNVSSIKDATLDVAAKTGNAVAAVAGTIEGQAMEGEPEPDRVEVSVQGVKAGSDLITLTVNGVSGSIPVVVYDKILPTDINISPSSAVVESGSAATFSIDGLTGLSTNGYQFNWIVVPIPTGLAWINGNEYTTSVEVGTNPDDYGTALVRLEVTPPDVNGSTDVGSFDMIATLDVQREGSLMLKMNSTLIAPLQKLLVGEVKAIPTTPSPAFTLECWKNGSIVPVTTSQIVYTSSNPSVVKVDDNGYLTPLSAGTATITATGVDYLNPDKDPASASFNLVVYSLTAPSTIEVQTGVFRDIGAVLAPTGGYLAYAVSPASGAIVSEGAFYASQAGTYAVMVYAYPSYEAYAADTSSNHAGALTSKSVLVRARDEATWITSNTPITIHVGDTIVVDPNAYTYTSALMPYSLITHGAITGWVSANPDVLGVDGDVITGLAEGTNQYVYATTSNGYRLYFRFTVSRTVVTGVTIAPVGDSKMVVGDIKQFSAAITPTSPVPDDTTIQWSTSDTSIAKVDQYGNVTAVAAGKAVLYAVSPDGPEDSVVITVVQQSEGILLSSSYLECYAGKSLPLTYQILTDGAEVDHVEVALSDTSVGSWVDGTLAVSLNAHPGDYLVTATLYGTGHDAGGAVVENMELGTDVCLLRVLQPVSTVELTSVTGSAISEPIKGIVGRSIIIRANVQPTNAADKSLLWDVENDQIATVEPITPFGAYARVTFVGTGSTSVIVKSAVSDASDAVAVTVVKEVTDFSLTPSYKDLYPGELFTYTVNLVPTDSMLVDKITYVSSDPAVASVNEYGTVVAIKPSATPVTISATYNNGLYDFTRTATVLVKNPVDQLQFVPSANLNMTVGNSRDLYAMLSFIGVDITLPVADKTVTWAVEKGNVLSIDKEGIARALAAGDTWVYVYAHNGRSAKIFINVNQNAQGLTLDTYSVAIRKGDTAVITATIMPVESTDVLEWTLPTGQTVVTASNPDSRTISVTGLNPGTTVVTATTYDASTHIKTAEKTCTVIVKQPVESITVESVLPAAIGTAYPKTVTANHIGQNISLVATALPVGAYDKSVTWSIVDQKVATIDPITGILTAVNIGRTTVKAQSVSDPSVYGLITVVVVRELITMSLTPDEKAIYQGDRFIITPSLLPEGTVLPPVEYVSSDPLVASLVTSVVNGITICKVTGSQPGTATITATIYKGTDNETTATCQVEVLVPLTEFTVEKDRIRMLVGDAYRYDLSDDLHFNDPLDQTTQPKDKTVTYTSLDPAIASVDAYGQITAKKVGTTIINIVPNANQSLRAQVTVEVVDLAAGVVADAAEIRVYPGMKIPVGFTFVPEEIASSAFTWTYFDEMGNPLADGEDIAFYNGGYVYTVNPGFVKLVATVKVPDDIQELYSKYPSLQFKEISTSILVTVLTPVDSVTIDSLDGEVKDPAELEELTYHVGDRFVLGASVLPDDATDPELLWTSSDSNIASVDSFGIVTANGTGTAKIYATSKNTGVQDSITIVVEKAPYAIRYGVATVSGLFVRNKPSLQGTVYTQFKKGKKMTIVGEYGEWYEIQYSKSPTGLAYVHRHYIRITGFAVAQNAEEPGSILTKSNATVNSKTTVWSGMGSGYRTTAPAGTRILVLAKKGSYYQITYGHHNLGTGYILASNVTKDDNFVYGDGKIIQSVPNGTGGYDSYIIDPSTGASIPLTGNTQVVSIPSSVTAASAPVYSGYDPATRVLIGRVYKGASLTIISEKMNGYYQVRLTSGVVGWVEAIYLAQPVTGGVETTVTVTVKVGKATTKVYLRERASTSSKKLATLKKGTSVTLVSTTKTNGFYQVTTAGGKTGYILAKYLKVTTQTRQETTVTPVYDQYGFVNCKLLNVRELGSKDGVIIATLKANEQVKILDEADGWYHIELDDGSYGYVKTEYITLIEA